jgi:histidyl-tRNA synthetase
MSHRALPGFRDFYPADLAVRDHVFGAMRRVARRYGFEEWDGPPLEALELYTEKSGAEIVGQLYHFVDRGGRAVALRPEMTPTLARMVAPRASALKKPIRWFSIPQLFRYERQQRGRLREHFQLNCDIIGEPGPLADAEIIALAIDVMRELGLGPADVRVRISDRRVLSALLRGRGVPEAGLPAAFEYIDKVERSRRDQAETVRPIVAQIAPATPGDLDTVARIRGWPALADELGRCPGAAEVARPLQDTAAALVAMGLGEFVDLDLSIVRGLAYYTGTVFELFDAARALRAICGGGRYDTLLASLGGVDLPALGFGMGDVVLTELLRDRGLLPAAGAAVEVFVSFVTADDRPLGLQLAHRLRDAGLRVEFAMGDQALARQLRLASARGARVALVIGPDDRARGEVVVKDLAAGSQRSVPTPELEAVVRSRLASGDRAPTPAPTS